MKIYYGDFSSTNWFSAIVRARFRVALQILVFSQSLFYGLAFWLTTHSAESAIHGFMIGTLSTILMALLQCNTFRCTRISLRIRKVVHSVLYNFFASTRSIVAILTLAVYSPAIAY